MEIAAPNPSCVRYVADTAEKRARDVGYRMEEEVVDGFPEEVQYKLLVCQ